MLYVRRICNIAFCRAFPEQFSKRQFKKMLGQKLDLRNPVGLNEKITWLKLNTYRNNPLITKCSDKYAVREYVAECGCSEILNELYGVWEKAEDICWEELPSSFVLKCNHGCGYNLLCPDKNLIDIDDIYIKLNRWLGEDYWLIFAEFQYKDIPKRIICEEYLGKSIVDYKFYCFNGKPLYVLVCIGRSEGKQSHTQGYEDPKFYFFNRDWEMCFLTKDSFNEPIDIEPPKNIEQMWKYAEKLCKSFPFVRVDLYDANEKVIFGELTFTPSAGLDTGRLQETDRLFGELLILDTKEQL